MQRLLSYGSNCNIGILKTYKPKPIILQNSSTALFQGMAEKRSMTRNQICVDASSRKIFKISHHGGVAPWSDLNHDVLFVVMMQLGVVDFLAFSGVCKSWRSLALSNRNMFMASRPPMTICISSCAYKKECYLKDFEGRKFKTLLPHSGARTCVGLTCGYLVLFGRITHDFWLVNPITRHELHFPDVHFYDDVNPVMGVRATLVFSPSISGWVFVVSNLLNFKIWFSVVGKGAWNYVSLNFPFFDLHVFKGKIYTLDTAYHLYEMRLNPEPKLTLLETKNFPKPNLLYPEFVSLGEGLCVMDCFPKDYEIYELEFGEMKWVSREKKVGEYAFFLSDLLYSVAIRPQTWDDPLLEIEYERYECFLPTTDKSKKDRFFNVDMWYFPHDCLNVNLVN